MNTEMRLHPGGALPTGLGVRGQGARLIALVIVLSNNDGCAIARTSEAKALGIKMGDPYFKIREMCRAQGVRVFSSNYTLYGDMSGRTNAVYRQFSPQVEIHSIDESFLNLSDVAPVLRVELARDLRATVRAWTGIPTCVGIGPTRTLAKLANHIAKTVPVLGGVCDLTDPAAYAHWLCRIDAAEVWGIGRASLPKLQAMGVESVADLRDLDPRPVRKGLTVVGERIIYELRGAACLPLEMVPARRKAAPSRARSPAGLPSGRCWRKRSPRTRRGSGRSCGARGWAPTTSRSSITRASTTGTRRCARFRRRCSCRSTARIRWR
ncbi:impB/mucB/samB family protein [Methylobacterium sp. yr668]|nr:impB/mucB/samB family protein [Methylobacterium sp. yr668]